MRDHGLDAVHLAATYHPIDSLSPRDTAHVYTDTRGAVYFPARESRYGRITPHARSRELSAVWLETASLAASLGLDINAWIVTTFQPWIRDVYPDCARVFPGGGASGSLVCPANDDVIEYVAALCSDLVDQFDVPSMQLEGILPTAYNFDWLRPRVIVRIPPLAQELLALCFCSTCIRKAQAAGIDAARVRGLVNETITAELAESSTNETADQDLPSIDAELREFAVRHVLSAVELVAACRVNCSTGPSFSSTVSTPYPLLLGEAENDVLERMAGAVDRVVIIGGDADTNERARDFATGHEPSRGISMLVTPWGAIPSHSDSSRKRPSSASTSSGCTTTDCSVGPTSNSSSRAVEPTNLRRHLRDLVPALLRFLADHRRHASHQ